jgi:hypothetical protein
MRGLNARIVEGGVVRVGDAVRRVPSGVPEAVEA